jgi:hypothetical protein
VFLISEILLTVNSLCAFYVYNLKQKPFFVLPALPARCLAEDWLIFLSSIEEIFEF